MKIPPIAALVLSFAVAAPAWAGLEFEERHIDVDAAPDDEVLPVVFKFKNSGEKPVKIERITFACSCLSAEADAESYAPGAEGTVTAQFKLGSFTGYQRKALTVIAQEEGAAAAERLQLMVGVKIPDVISIEPELLSWTVGEEPLAKTFTLRVPYKDPIAVRQITCSRAGFDFELKVVEEGRHYEIELVPESTDSPMLGVLKIETDCEVAKHQRKLAFFSIARKPRGGN